MDLFKKVFGGGKLTCPMCSGEGKLPPPDPHLEIRFGDKPENLSVEELALVMANAGKLEELSKKLGVDPYSVKVSFEFENTHHKMSFMVAREKRGT